MSTDYFILSKKSIVNNKNDTICTLDTHEKINYILPKNLLGYYHSHGLFENTLIDWSKQFCNPSMNMLDIGAHTGTYSLSLAQYCKHVYSFEPQKMTFYALCGSVSLSSCKNITCFNFGLGSTDQVGECNLNIISNDGGGSTIQKCDSPVMNTEKIVIKTLDSLILSDISFIKIDVEGNELDTLKGSVETLARNNYPHILFESNVKNVELEQFLKDMSYEIHNINGYSNMFIAKGKGRSVL